MSRDASTVGGAESESGSESGSGVGGVGGGGGGGGGGRSRSLDAYRGLVMLAMVSGGFGFAAVAKESFPESPVWRELGFQFSHVEWRGWAFWDMIQPSFMFMVGVSLAYSRAARLSRGQSEGGMLAHAVWRSLVLVVLALFLESLSTKSTNFTFVNVLAQIGLGYTFLHILSRYSARVQLAAAVLILAGHWGLFAWWGGAPAETPSTELGLPADWERLTGLEAAWEKHTNVGARVDSWLLNRFPRHDGKPFERNPGGYTTINFVPSLATMIFGLMAGGLLRSNRAGWSKALWLIAAGCAGLGIGAAMDGRMIGLDSGICPLVKRIWTPSWAIFSAGFASLTLGAFYLIVDAAGIRFWTWPLAVVGMNSIAMYVMSFLFPGTIRRTFETHLGSWIYEGTYGPIVKSVSVLLVLWLICAWMHRRKLFIKI